MKYESIPQYLYHGTSRRNYEAMLACGYAAPRAQLKFGAVKSNWTHTVESNRDIIYLTTAYPLHFSASAASGHEEMVVVEVDTSLMLPALFVADEDAIEQCGRGRDKLPKTWGMRQRTMYYRQRSHRYDPCASLSALGTCGYRGAIPTRFFSRALIIPTDAWAYLVLNASMDPTVSVQHYQLLGDLYENNMRWMFGDAPFRAMHMLAQPVEIEDPETAAVFARFPEVERPASMRVVRHAAAPLHAAQREQALAKRLNDMVGEERSDG